MKILFNNIKLRPDENEDILIKKINEISGIHVSGFFILKKSLDARKKNDIHFVCRVVVDCNEDEGTLLIEKNLAIEWHPPEKIEAINLKNKKLIIVGFGPAGLFAALRAIDSGAQVILIERGKAVEERMHDISILENSGILNTESNVLFGEGGAGTYSDGKLTTRTSRKEISWFYDELIRFGADDSISYTAHSHIGTDKLRKIIINIREYLLSNGAEIFFNTIVSDLIIKDNQVLGVKTSDGKEFFGDGVLLAIGHSARDTYEMLYERGILLEKKGFAVGSRIEHSADFIKRTQYGNSQYYNNLSAAEYRLTNHNKNNDRGTYSFCMCPGGYIINSSSENGMLCTNGMSNSHRDGKFSNAAIVVTVKPEDVDDHPLGGIKFQRDLEAAAFDAGGGDFIAPAQRVTSFTRGFIDKDLPESSYKGGVIAKAIHEILPQWIVSEMRQSLKIFDRRMKGFVSEEALLIGVETRTSSPVRIVRGKSFESVSHRGLFPIGEGAGYAGGIVSSAVDGIRAVDLLVGE